MNLININNLKRISGLNLKKDNYIILNTEKDSYKTTIEELFKYLKHDIIMEGIKIYNKTISGEKNYIESNNITIYFIAGENIKKGDLVKIDIEGKLKKISESKLDRSKIIGIANGDCLTENMCKVVILGETDIEINYPEVFLNSFNEFQSFNDNQINLKVGFGYKNKLYFNLKNTTLNASDININQINIDDTTFNSTNLQDLAEELIDYNSFSKFKQALVEIKYGRAQIEDEISGDIFDIKVIDKNGVCTYYNDIVRDGNRLIFDYSLNGLYVSCKYIKKI